MRHRLLRLFPLLALAAALTLAGCGLVVRSVDRAAQGLAHAGQPGRHGRLTERELQWAKTAWKYFQNHTSAQTGLVAGTEQQPVVTLWQLADTLAALVAAHELGLIDRLEFDRRMSPLLAFLNHMPLAAPGVPARAYEVAGGQIAQAPGQAGDGGWTAIELGRLLTWMKIAGQRHPQFREYLDKAVLRWNFCPVIDDCGVLFGHGGEPGSEAAPVGSLGLLQYASAGFAAWGFETRGSAQPGPVATIDLLGVRLPFDARDERVSGEPAPVLTMPHVLLGLEFGWEPPGVVPGDAERLRAMAQDVFRVQEQRFLQQGVLTARTEHALRNPPHQLVDAVFAAGYPWNTLSPQGRAHPGLALVATRAVFGMWALWPGPYTDRLMTAVEALHSPERGWFEGRYEQSGGHEDLATLSTNAAVLEALLFKRRGPLRPAGDRPGYFDFRSSDIFAPLHRCLPAERAACRAPAAAPPAWLPASERVAP